MKKIIGITVSVAFLSGLSILANHWELKKSITEGKTPISVNLDEVGNLVADWANDHYKNDSIVVGKTDIDGDEITPVLPLRLAEVVPVTVISIPQDRIPKTKEPIQYPEFYALVLLEDAHGQLFETAVQSTSLKTNGVSVGFVGPALDMAPEVRDLKPHERVIALEDHALHKGNRKIGEPIALIPYPFPMDQLFFQRGDDPISATFVDVVTGETYEGIHAVLDAVDEAWDKL